MDHEAVELEPTALVKIEKSEVSLGTMRAQSPKELVENAADMAFHLAQVIEKQKLYNSIQGKRFVRVEGWTCLALMLGIVPREISNEPIEGGGYLATVALVRMSDGFEITRASAECGADEPTWASRPSYARRSMAATRATGKACRLAFSWIISMAGFEATAAEEMPTDDARSHRKPRPQAQPARGSAQRPERASEPPAGSQTVLARFVNYERIDGISKKNNRPYVIHRWHAADGEVYSSMDSGHLRQVEADMEALWRVEFETNQYGNRILRLEQAMEDAELPFADVPDEEIPDAEKPF